MRRPWTNALFALLLIGTLTGCATTQEELLPHEDATILDIWGQNTGGQTPRGRVNRPLMEARQALRRPLTEMEAKATEGTHAAYTRTAENEITRLFKRLPNPDLVLFVFPHLAGTDPVPVPGYSTVFPFYQRVQYAMPGERTEDY